MEHIWSPWRSALIDSPKEVEEPGVTLFSRIAAEDKDEENMIVWRGETVFVIMNAFPYNNGHLLIVPYRPVETYERLTREEQMEIAATIERCILWQREALQPHGFNIGINIGKAGGAGVPDHLHVHVIPRWNGDTNFMPTIADTKVVPEAMRASYNKLRSAARSLESAGRDPHAH